ncbi:hypothetical protein OIU77_022697 [Salix suchowensis]|uniref:Uncharacterized protein n=1 Tax=Salix suchowensis TaxID=1278906 RepID=A0ABQ9C161_9ROSI|nr:hypothetical protein OIU77_022697 [Salix suchowensis]
MMQFDLNTTSLPGHGDHHLFFKFELRSEGAIFGNKAIGEVRVPFKDLIEGFNGSVRIVNYHVRNSDEEPIGVLSFSYEVKEKIKRIDTQKVIGHREFDPHRLKSSFSIRRNPMSSQGMNAHILPWMLSARCLLCSSVIQ